jgi:large subunit ribosomal protein L32e
MSKRFKHQENWKYVRLGDRWRKPRGGKNPIKRCKNGRTPLPTVGYRTPVKIRGLHPSGLKEVRVFTPSELKGLDAKKNIVRIGRTVGGRKRALIVNEAKKLKLRVIQSESSGSKKTGK